jgi:hypothetical protein
LLELFAGLFLTGELFTQQSHLLVSLLFLLLLLLLVLKR